MYVEIQASGFVLSDHLKNHIHEKLLNALQSANTKVRKVIVRLFNDDARHNRKMRSCRVHVMVKGMPDIVTSYSSRNIYKASNAAIKTSSFTVKNKFNKRRKLNNLKKLSQSIITS